jgi:hypothetical protein
VVDRDPNIVISGLSGEFTKDGMTVEVHILRLEQGATWTLEVVNSSGTSIVWDDPFACDEQAYAEFQRTVAEEGMKAFADEEEHSNVIPFRRPH